MQPLIAPVMQCFGRRQRLSVGHPSVLEERVCGISKRVGHLPSCRSGLLLELACLACLRQAGIWGAHVQLQRNGPGAARREHGGRVPPAGGRGSDGVAEGMASQRRNSTAGIQPAGQHRVGAWSARSRPPGGASGRGCAQSRRRAGPLPCGAAPWPGRPPARRAPLDSGRYIRWPRRG